MAGCKFCPQLNAAKLITSDKLNITEKIRGAGNYKEREVIYAAQCSKHKVLYFGHTRKNFRSISPNIATTSRTGQNSELAKHFHQSRNINDNLKITILQNNIKTAAAWRYHEDKWICRLKTSAPHGLNAEIGDYAKEMYKFY